MRILKFVYTCICMYMYIVGTTKVTGAFPVGPLIENELARKCHVIDKSIMDNIHKATTGMCTCT